MTFNEYLRDRRCSQAAFYRRVGLGSTVTNRASNNLPIGLEAALRIVAGTGGEVTLSELNLKVTIPQYWQFCLRPELLRRQKSAA